MWFELTTHDHLLLTCHQGKQYHIHHFRLLRRIILRDVHNKLDALNECNACSKHDASNGDDSIPTTAQIFDGVDFGPILDYLHLICRNRHIRTSDGLIYSADSNFSFSERYVCFAVRNYPDSLLCQCFNPPWPYFH